MSLRPQNTQIPKGQHFLPVMLLRRFTDESGRLFFFSKRCPEKGVLPGTPEQLFRETHIYTAKDRAGTTDVSLEKYYSKIEGAVSLIIEKIVTSARNGLEPHLTPQERDTWDSFFGHQWRRVPDLHRKILEEANFESFVKRTLNAIEAVGGPLPADVRRDLQEPSAVKRIKQNAKVQALKTSPAQVLGILKGKGLGIAVIRDPGASFVIGSLPIVKVTSPGHVHLADPEVTAWLPISSDVAISPAPCPPDAVLIAEVSVAYVRILNAEIFSQSTSIAGRSPDLIASLANVC